MTLTNVAEFLELFREFVPSFLTSFRGDRYVRLYEEATQAARGNYEEIAAAYGRREDLGKRVFTKLLPHAESPEARRAGAWVHYAPVIAGDIRAWFEGAGWITPLEWGNAAAEIFRFFERCRRDPADLEGACRAFGAFPFAAGFHPPLLSPMLHALRPLDFALINNRSRWTLEYFLEEEFPHTLDAYPAVGAAARAAIERLAPEMTALAQGSRHTPDQLFDIFAHWLVAVKGFFKKPIPDPRDEHEPVRLDRRSTTDAAATLARLYPDPAVRRRCARLLADAVRTAHRLSPGNWEISLFEEKIRLNIGNTEVAVLYPNEIYLVIDGDALGRPEREVLADVFEISEEWYESVPGAKGWGRIPAAQIDEYLHMTRLPHRSLMEKASAASENAAWPEHHSTGVTAYLREFLKRKVPDPAYIAQRDSGEIAPAPTAPIVAEEGAGYESGGQAVPEEPYDIDQCAEETGAAKESIERWAAAIERKGQAILYGPPGTGKTYIAQRLAKLIVSGGDGFVQLVQFHPAYTYEDFVIGIRPQTREDGTLEYPLVPGRFLLFCMQAAGRANRCVLVIDEINRANVSRVFGELMYLLEYRDREIPLAGGRSFSIPSNVRIIGTMNSADRSIALVDHALRRRFAMIEIRPDYDILRRYHAGRGHGIEPEGLIRVLRRVNDAIGDPHYELGISFFMREEIDRHIEDIWRMEIEPYLAEYFFDQPAKVEAFRWGSVSGEILG